MVCRNLVVLLFCACVLYFPFSEAKASISCAMSYSFEVKVKSAKHIIVAEVVYTGTNLIHQTVGKYNWHEVQIIKGGEKRRKVLEGRKEKVSPDVYKNSYEGKKVILFFDSDHQELKDGCGTRIFLESDEKVNIMVGVIEQILSSGNYADVTGKQWYDYYRKARENSGLY